MRKSISALMMCMSMYMCIGMSLPLLSSANSGLPVPVQHWPVDEAAVTLTFDGMEALFFGRQDVVSVGILDAHNHTPSLTITRITASSNNLKTRNICNISYEIKQLFHISQFNAVNISEIESKIKQAERIGLKLTIVNNKVNPGHVRLCDLQPLDIQSVYSNMLDKGLSARTVRYTHSVLSSALKQAVKWRKLMQNPASLVELPKKTFKEMQALSSEDAAKFLEAAKKDAHDTIFVFALVTGMRPSEYLGLQWKDIDLQKGVVTEFAILKWPTDPF